MKENFIENPNPETWKDLQNGVCNIFSEIGLNTVTEKIIKTPRGSTEVDVYAIDEKSVDKIKYLVECKNWEVGIPQSVVHGFTTIMHETGANIGFIISKKGMQSGARNYTESTNIIGLTYAEFQARYFDVWYRDFFISQIGKCADSLIQYTEPINSRRQFFIDKLSSQKKEEYIDLYKHYDELGIIIVFLCHQVPYKKITSIPDLGIEQYKIIMKEYLGEEFSFSSIYYRDLLAELISKIQKITDQFNNLFGFNVFEIPRV
jgi:hypothetical protein